MHVAYSQHSIAIHSISMAGYVTAVSPFLLKQTLGFFQMCSIRSAIANLCPNTIHFDPLDFSECRTEEVISFF